MHETKSDLERLGDEIAELSAHLHAATYRLLVRLCEFDEREGWDGGFLSCAHWLSWRTGIAPGAAREKVRVARALAHLPLTGEAMRKGTLSYTKVRAITRVATAETEGQLLELARHGTAAQLETIVRAWRRMNRLEEQQEDKRRRDARSLTLYIDDDGSYVIRGRLDPETGALLERALEAACDSTRVVMTHDADGNVLDVGRRTRTVPTPIRRALEHRDQGCCRFPGCRNRFCDAHHLEHWVDGGETRLSNLVLLCTRHHTLVHEGGFHVIIGSDDKVCFERPDGRVIPNVPDAPELREDPVAKLQREHDELEIDAWTPTSEWRGECLDLEFASMTAARR